MTRFVRKGGQGTAGSSRHHSLYLLLSGALVLTGLAGCWSATPNVIPLTESEQNLTNIVLAYRDAQPQLNHWPKNAEELKPFLKTFGDPDQLLISPNDHEPYVVVWGADTSRGGPTDYQGMWGIIAYERTGAGGRRAVVDIRGRPMTIPEEDFSKLTFAGGHKPQGK
jgi:hypothetical protein